MGNLVKYFFLGFLAFAVIQYMYDNKVGLFDLLKPRDSETKIVFNKPKYQHSIEKDHQKNLNKETIIIRPLGEVDYDDLVDASNIIRSFYKFNTIIVDGIPIEENMYIRNSTDILDADVCIRSIPQMQKTLYIVDKRLWATGDFLRGYAFVNGNTIIVRGEKSFLRETIIHEIGHTLGLGHCSDLTCVMALNNDEYDSGDFCNKCKNQLNNK